MALVALVLATALGLRLWGINFGLPHRYHVDEPYYVLGALQIGQGNFEMVAPQNAPNLWQFILFAEYAVLYVIGRVAGAFGQPSDLANLYFVNPSIYYALGRLSSALAGVATVGLTYLLGKRLFDRRTGLIAGALLAVAFLHVRESHFAVNDALVTLLTTFAMYAAVARLEGRRWGLLLLGGLAIGAAIGMKYRPVVFGLPLLVATAQMSLAALQRGPSAPVSRALLPVVGVGLAVALGFLIGYPGIFLNPLNSSSHLAATANSVTFASASIPTASYLTHLARITLALLRLLAIGVGLPMLLAAAVGVALVFGRVRRDARSRAAAWLAVTGVVYFALVAWLLADLARYLLPLLPLIALFAGLALTTLHARLARTARSPGAALISAALLLAVAVPPLISSARFNHLVTKTDTRTLAKIWIEEHIPAGSRIATDWPVHGPPLATPTDPEPGSTALYDVAMIGGGGLSSHPVEYYLNEGYDYLIASSFIVRMNGLEPPDFYTDVASRFELVAQFSATDKGDEPPYIFDEIFGPIISLWQRDRPGPELWIYKLSGAPTS